MSFSEKWGQKPPPRLILLTQLFDPEPTFKGLLFARALKDRGYNVEVVTGFPNYPGGKIYDGYKIRAIQRETKDGVAITRLPLYPSHNNRALSRIANYLSFSISVFVYLIFFARRAHIIYVYHPPLTVGFAAGMAKLFRRTPTVIDIQDMWPDTLAATGMVHANWLLRLVGFVCRWTYARMTHLVVLAPGFKRVLISRGVPEEKLTVIYNWADENALAVAPSTRPSLMPRDGRFKLLFAGNMGLAQDLDVVIDAAKIVSANNSSVDFCFLGRGLETDRLKKRAVDEGLSCVHFFPQVPMAEVGHYLAAADALLVILRPDPLFEITIPSKTQAYMSAGRPIIMAVAGDAAVLVERAEAGIAVRPGDAAALADAIVKMMGLPTETRSKMGQSAQDFYRSNLSLQHGVAQFDDLFKAVLG
jgi:colanic acid biosynthesis glycosyl transferase WcaI